MHFTMYLSTAYEGNTYAASGRIFRWEKSNDELLTSDCDKILSAWNGTYEEVIEKIVREAVEFPNMDFLRIYVLKDDFKTLNSIVRELKLPITIETVNAKYVGPGYETNLKNVQEIAENTLHFWSNRLFD